MLGVTTPTALESVRVADLSEGIAGAYCTKVLADAGADVVKVERPGGDPLRSWGSGALFEYLHTSKRSTTGPADDVVARADVVVADGGLDPARLRASAPSLVVVTITPFGWDSPARDAPWTEFTLQAACGSIGGRGLPDGPPLAAGGRIGEWVAGVYAALGAVAAWREARRSGHGDHVDVAILDAMALAMAPYPSLFASFAGWGDLPGTGRSIEVPSVEPASDGYVGFTTNSAQQFHDFLLLIERPDLVEDGELALVAKRFARRDEFLAAVHAHTRSRTTATLLEEANLYRIPAAPVLDGATIPAFEQFAARSVFVANPSGRFAQPRVPFRIDGVEPRPFAPAPGAGQHTGAVGWEGEPRPAPAPAGAWRPPLDGVRVVDCTSWWAGPSASHALACLGADVIKVESVTRPDHCRFAGTRRPPADQWWEWGPIFHGVNTNKRGITVDLARPEGRAVFGRLLDGADVLMENNTPRVMEQFGLNWGAVHAAHPSLVMVRMPAFGLDGPWRDRTGFAQTMECLTGMAWRTGFPDGPPVLVRGACDPIAGLHAAIATVLALDVRRRREGAEGMLVEVTMAEAALNVAAELVVEYGASGTSLGRLGNRGPGAPQGVYRCAGDDRWVALAVMTDAQWAALDAVVGRPGWEGVVLDDAAARRRHHDLIDRLLARWTAGREAEDVAAALLGAGVPAAAVVSPRRLHRQPDLAERGLFETEGHPVTGDHPVPMLPFRLSRLDRWLRAPAPTLGQHNDEVLAELGLDAAARTRLREAGVIGERPLGA